MPRLHPQTAVLAIVLALSCRHGYAAPPFDGTIFIDPDIITPADPTAFDFALSGGRGFRWMFDRRTNDWAYLDAYLFNAHFDDGLTAEIQVNPEFGNATTAAAEALKYAAIIGQLPTALRVDVETVWIHRGSQPFGGGNNNLLIHTGQANDYAALGILEETLIHEASHTSLDAIHASAPDWLAAQQTDDEFISTYARDNPVREDIAESFLSYLAVRYRPGRISDALSEVIMQTIPNRIDYFDAQSFDLYPIVSPLPTPGDINNDGDVDRRDIARFASYFGRGLKSDWTTGDFDGDGMTSLADLAILQANLRDAGPADAMPVPEPQTSAMLFTVLVAASLMKVGFRAVRSR